ncbi:MAG: hypothetical protein IJN57_04950, partial [Oscillospiraceae bacterium]|nr:hypothetical protein [Oscillospiraceae bacterium]
TKNTSPALRRSGAVAGRDFFGSKDEVLWRVRGYAVPSQYSPSPVGGGVGVGAVTGVLTPEKRLFLQAEMTLSVKREASFSVHTIRQDPKAAHSDGYDRRAGGGKLPEATGEIIILQESCTETYNFPLFFRSLQKE